ncbi:MAG: ribosome biogenesis GTPase Der [Mariniblastus sp.]
MSLPQVSIVGRPNVGKSSIFNWLAGRRLAIVDDMAGVTRDRMNVMLEEEGRYFEIVDTGGIGLNDVDELEEEIEHQIELGIQGADVLMFVVDAKAGKTGLDQKVTERLRGLDKPIILVANKCDGDNWEIEANEFFSLGFGKPVCVSAKNNRRRHELLDALLEALPSQEEIDKRDTRRPEMKFALVGRRNVGKSTFINTLVESDRMIVSEVAGTTRDSVDVRFELDGKTMVAIDTPGLRKGKAVKTDVEWYGTHRAHRTIRHADVILMTFDCSQRISKVDRKLCTYIEQAYKPCIFVVNKWDLMAEHMETKRWADYIHDNFSTMWNAPIAFVTGKTGQNCKRLLNHAQMLYKQSRARVSTPKLNRIVKEALVKHAPPMASNKKRPKIYYAAQIGIEPPTIMLKCNNPDAFSKTYQRYLLGVLRDSLDFGEVPIRLVLEKRSSADADGVSLEESRS